jgi:hypothetical protein
MMQLHRKKHPDSSERMERLPNPLQSRATSSIVATLYEDTPALNWRGLQPHRGDNDAENNAEAVRDQARQPITAQSIGVFNGSSSHREGASFIEYTVLIKKVNNSFN